MNCIICGHSYSPIDPFTHICERCQAKHDWEENYACSHCYVNERDPKSSERLCYTCQQIKDLMDLQNKS